MLKVAPRPTRSKNLFSVSLCYKPRESCYLSRILGVCSTSVTASLETRRGHSFLVAALAAPCLCGLVRRRWGERTRTNAALRRVGGGCGPGLHTRERRERAVLHAGSDGLGCRALRLRQRRRPRRLSRAGRAARNRWRANARARGGAGQPAVSERPHRRRVRGADAPLHRCDRTRRQSASTPTAWAPRRATTTTTATSTCSSPSFGPDTLLSQQRRRHVQRRDDRRPG